MIWKDFDLTCLAYLVTFARTTFWLIIDLAALILDSCILCLISQSTMAPAPASHSPTSMPRLPFPTYSLVIVECTAAWVTTGIPKTPLLVGMCLEVWQASVFIVSVLYKLRRFFAGNHWQATTVSWLRYIVTSVGYSSCSMHSSLISLVYF